MPAGLCGPGRQVPGRFGCGERIAAAVGQDPGAVRRRSSRAAGHRADQHPGGERVDPASSVLASAVSLAAARVCPPQIRRAARRRAGCSGSAGIGERCGEPGLQAFFGQVRRGGGGPSRRRQPGDQQVPGAARIRRGGADPAGGRGGRGGGSGDGQVRQELASPHGSTPSSGPVPQPRKGNKPATAGSRGERAAASPLGRRRDRGQSRRRAAGRPARRRTGAAPRHRQRRDPALIPGDLRGGIAIFWPKWATSGPWTAGPRAGSPPRRCPPSCSCGAGSINGPRVTVPF